MTDPRIAALAEALHKSDHQITVCRPDLGLHIKCEHAIKCPRCDGYGDVAGNAAGTKPPVGCPSCGGTGFKRHRAALEAK